MFPFVLTQEFLNLLWDIFMQLLDGFPRLFIPAPLHQQQDGAIVVQNQCSVSNSELLVTGHILQNHWHA